MIFLLLCLISVFPLSAFYIDVYFSYFLRKQLDEKNKEFYDLKVVSTTQEMSLREAQLKVKELESSLKNEINFRQSVACRYELKWRCSY